jgi:DNA-binding response OmpR family regulator
MGEAARGRVVAVIGAAHEPTAELIADLERLDYQPRLIVWPTSEVQWAGPLPFATLMDLRAIAVDIRRACHLAREDRALRGLPLVAVVPEQEASRLDLSLGFDDLVLAPYRLGEVAARLRLIAWRSQSEPAPGVIRLGRLTLDETTYQVAIDGLPIDLTLKEFQLLLFLARSPGRVFTREDLLDRVWGQDYFGGTRTVDVHVRRVRAKTEAAGDLIETVRGVGYRLVRPE